MGCGSSVQRDTFSGTNTVTVVPRTSAVHASLVIDNPGEVGTFYDMEKKELGEGSYGKVFKAKGRQSNAERAIKKCFKTDDKQIAAFKKEISCMKVLDHPNVIKLFEVYEDSYCIYMVMEIATGGQLLERVIESNGFSEHHCALIMRQVFRAVHYMHNLSICHRDIKPENILMQDKEPLSECTLKLIDFGFATNCPVKAGPALKTKAGSPLYCAPEVLTGSYNELCDLWSSGVVLFLLLSGRTPFDGANEAEITKNVKRASVEFVHTSTGEWSPSEDVKDLIKVCLAKDPKERVTAQNALHHTWVKNLAPRGSNVTLPKNLTNGLRSYVSSCRLKQTALQAIVKHAPREDLKQLTEVWSRLDKDCDGLLTIGEMRAGLKNANLSSVSQILQPALDEMGTKCEADSEDIDNAPFLDYTQFMAAIMDRQAYEQEDVCMNAFRVFDINGDGKISLQEVSKVLDQQEVSQAFGRRKSTNSLFREVDTSGDGVIDFSEFMVMMRQESSPQDSATPPDAEDAAKGC